MSKIIEICKKYSMISEERFKNNINSVKTVQKKNILGDIVEIGVWKGGSILSMILEYEKYQENNRTFHLYDTFSGMTDPTIHDKDLWNNDASLLLNYDGIKDVVKAAADLDEVKSNICNHTKYEKIQYHQGDILKNKYYPEKIAILRLDTDWYESTKYELDNFYDKVSLGGIVIIDDYGHWKGCKQAVDEFLANHPKIKIKKTDYTGIWFTKID
jgi:hypothetical protein